MTPLANLATLGGSSATSSSATATTGNVAGMFQNPSDELDEELEERRRKALAAGQVGSGGKISTMLGYSGMPTGNPLNLKPYG